ncbi:MAG: hypothetical protein R2777_04325 [Chitinophagales bacterium]
MTHEQEGGIKLMLNKQNTIPGYSPYHFGYLTILSITIDPNGEENIVVVKIKDILQAVIKKGKNIRYGENKGTFWKLV